jgi:hypothetical protein
VNRSAIATTLGGILFLTAYNSGTDKQAKDFTSDIKAMGFAHVSDATTDTEMALGMQLTGTTPKPRPANPKPAPKQQHRNAKSTHTYYELTVEVAGCTIELERKGGTIHVETTRKGSKIETYAVDEGIVNGQVHDIDDIVGAPTPQDVENFLSRNRTTFSCYKR